MWPQWLRLPYRAEPPRESSDERLTRLAKEADDALAFLTSPGAISAYQRLLQRFADQVLESAPEALEARELAYQKAHVLQELVREMAAAVQAWEVERERMKRQN